MKTSRGRSSIPARVRTSGSFTQKPLERDKNACLTGTVRERDVVYLGRKSPKASAENTGTILVKVFRRGIQSDMDVIEISRQGVTKGSLTALGQAFDYTTDMLASMLPITLRTIQRYDNNKKFDSNVSEHIVQLARLMVRGTEAFGSRDNFKRWFNTPNLALGGQVPSELVNLQTGAQLIMDELSRIEHGIFA
jgi:putative toxin-antitoxin system antitoxin component (TIGR02293 family)